MSLNNNNNRIRVNVYEEESPPTTINITSYLSFSRDSRPDNVLYEHVLFSENEQPSESISRALNSVRMVDIISGFFGGIMDSERILEDRMMDIAMRESLDHYKTQEKKPGIKLCIKSILSTGEHKGELCAICKEDFELNEKLTVLTCNHIYHTECIGEWVKYKSECAVCRAIIPDKFIKDENNLIPE